VGEGCRGRSEPTPEHDGRKQTLAGDELEEAGDNEVVDEPSRAGKMSSTGLSCLQRRGAESEQELDDGEETSKPTIWASFSS
jgi:hypothetical protein